MEINETKTDGVCTVNLAGNLALNSVYEAKSSMNDLFSDKQFNALILNCESINIIDLNGTGLLLFSL